MGDIMSSYLDGTNDTGESRKYAEQDRQSFQLIAKRNRIVGLWAAEKFGYKGDDALRYATEVVFSDLKEPGDEDIIRKLMADFDYHGISVTRKEVENQLLNAEKSAKS